MGAWSHESFGNDTACDWAHDLVETQDFSLVARAIQEVLENGPDYLDCDLAVEAVAATEVLAKVRGRGTQTDAYTEKLDTWLKSVPATPPPELFVKARQALSRILGEDSELRELWEESEDFASWQGSMHALQAALA